MMALRWIGALLLALAVALFLLTDAAPAVRDAGPPTAETLAIARPIASQVPAPGVGGADVAMRLSAAELAALAQLGSTALAPARLGATTAAGALTLYASRPAPLGRWWNVEVRVGADPLHPSLRIGSVPVPAALANPLLRLGWRGVRARDPALPPLDRLVRDLRTTPQGVSARVDTNAARRLFDLVSSARGGGGIRADVASAAYCRVARAGGRGGVVPLAPLVAAALEGVRDPADARAALNALAAAVAPEVADRLAPELGPARQRCPMRATAALGRRGDLPKHWAVSAALTARFGAQASEALGTWKELADSETGGSGFSFVDLAADRSGFRWGAALTDPARSAAARAALMRGEEDRLLPPALLAAPEGVSREAFEARWRDTGSASYAAALRRIDAALDPLIPR